MLRRSAVFLSLVLVNACGASREVEPAPGPRNSISTPGQLTFDGVKALTDVSCKRCHASDAFLKTEAAWRASRAKGRLSSREMPPASTNEAKGLSEANRSLLINF